MPGAAHKWLVETGMRCAILAAGLLLVGCGGTDKVADAQKELQIVENSGGNARDLCKARRKVEEAYLAAHNES